MGERERERWGNIFYMDPDREGLVTYAFMYLQSLLLPFLFVITLMQFAVTLFKCSRRMSLVHAVYFVSLWSRL